MFESVGVYGGAGGRRLHAGAAAAGVPRGQHVSPARLLPHHYEGARQGYVQSAHTPINVTNGTIIPEQDSSHSSSTHKRVRSGCVLHF